MRKLLHPLNVGIVDCDLIDHGTRHPNLALMKLSRYMKEQGHECHLVESIAEIADLESTPYDKIIAAKVFTFSKAPDIVLQHGVPGMELADYTSRERVKSVLYGGTGFVYEGRTFPPRLPPEIEHIKPDYTLYHDWVRHQVASGKKESAFHDYTQFSIGFTTRGCFRRCKFCVNQHYREVEVWSPVEEFVDPTLPYIYLWDDNFLGLGIKTRMEDIRLNRKQPWENILDQLDAQKKPFQFRQGLDMRLMTEGIAERFSHCMYHGDYIFAFDHVKDAPVIARNVDIWKKYNRKLTKFYVLCGFDGIDELDIANTFKRIKILMEHGAIPYIMRYENYRKSKYAGLYVQLARWCNQPQFFKKKSFREYCIACQDYYLAHGGKHESCAPYAAMKGFELDHPEIAKLYYDIRFDRQGT